MLQTRLLTEYLINESPQTVGNVLYNRMAILQSLQWLYQSGPIRHSQNMCRNDSVSLHRWFKTYQTISRQFPKHNFENT